MAKFPVPQTSSIFAVVIFILLVLSVGLLVFVLRGQMAHENAKQSQQTPTSKPSTSTTTARPATAQPDIQSDHTLPEQTPWLDFRLSRHVLPLHYDLLLHPDLKLDVFSGRVNITVNVTRATRHFVVHAYRLHVKDCSVYGDDDVEWKLETSFVYNPHEYFVMTTERQAGPGIYKLNFVFGGSLNGTIIGFYKSRYKDGNNQTRYLATSKFQPTYARRAFPCFDEPSFKSTFSVSLVHDHAQTALSNMPAQMTEPYADSLYVTRFQKSVPMVTYLACFIVSDFHFKGTTTTSGKPFRVYTTPDQVNLTSYALQFGSRVLEYFEKYFGIDYPLPKQDMVAIPDFSSGAMEHWGVITFRETNLLFDPVNSSPQNKQRISAVIAHEMTHMWFGNLVTMEWWDDLWLNEGFASYVEYKGVDEQHPEWDTLSQFVSDELQPVMKIDSALSSHPIVQPVNHPDEITEIFDDISYGKGASILRMLEFFVGKENFRNGISNFLKKYQYKNTKTQDLWEELSQACGHPGNHSIAAIMKTWTQQMGFPYITVVRRTSQNASLYIAKQRRFLKNEVPPNRQEDATQGYVWTVPLSYVTGDGKSGIAWMDDQKELHFTVPVPPSEWVKFNVNQTGFYLVNYEPEEWNRFITLLNANHTALSPSDRSNLLFDSVLLSEAGHVPFEVFLAMSQYLRNETHLIPWETAYASLVHMCQLLEATDVNPLLKSYIRDLTDNLYTNLGWKTTENHLDNLLRTTIIGLACHSGNNDCLSQAVELFQNWTRGQHVPSSLRSMVYNFGMSEIGNAEHWNYMWNKYLIEESPAHKKALMNGLAHVKKPEIILRYLESAMDERQVRSQDFFTILSYIAGNSVGRPLVWNFVREKWPLLVERFTLNNRYLGNAVKKICGYFTTDIELQEMEAFFTKYPDAGAGKRRRQQALEVVKNNIKWIKTYSRGVKTWLQSEGRSLLYYHRLPTTLVPIHYDLLLQPIMERNVFNGTVTILAQLKKPSNYLLVHAAPELDVTTVKVTSGDESLVMDDVFRNTDHDYLVIKMVKKLPEGMYRLHFEFEGPLTASLKGLYKSSYVDPVSNERRYLATTQFAAVDARRVFPCFDEPSFKATFNVSVVHESTTHFALSNTQVQSVSMLENNLQVTTFEKSVPMVTYLLCVIVSDFKYKENVTENGVKLRVYSAPHLVEKTNYALEVAGKILTFYEKYFGIKFPLKKLDLVAVPDMYFSAMENWGLITFSEERLLADNTSSIETRHRIARMIAHELAHMWFGNLVTMQWWNDVWLNEGFATYMVQKGMRYLKPNINEDNDGGLKDLVDAMSSDRSIHSHPIVQPVEKVTADIYDDIQYLKGSSMLRMLEGCIGDTTFSAGVSNYLKKHSYKNARTEDLWDALTSSAKGLVNVSRMMDTWTRQMNYPYIDIRREEGDIFFIQQHRFLEDSASKILSTVRSPYNYVWQIPITYRTSDSSDITYVLIVNSSERNHIPVPKNSWIKFNVDFSGYYSVNYDLKDWEIFINILKNNHSEFSCGDRVGFLFDSFSLASAGHLPYSVPLSLVGYLGQERCPRAWAVALQQLTRIRKLFRADRDTKEIIKEYIRSLSKNLLTEYGWNDTGSYSDRQLRKIIIETACEIGNQVCLETAGILLNQSMHGGSLSRDTRALVYKYGLRSFIGEGAWAWMWQKYLVETDPYEKQILRDALATSRNTTLLERLLRYAGNETLVRRQHYLDLLQKIALNPKGLTLVTHHIFNRWPKLVSTYGLQESGEFAANVFKGFTSEKDLEKVREFHRRHPTGKAGSKFRALALDNVYGNIRWLRKHQERVREWFRDNVYMPWKNSRLPAQITPAWYNITLHPDMSSESFTGYEDIELDLSSSADLLQIHEGGRLRVTRTELLTWSGLRVPVKEEFSYRKNEFRVLLLSSPIPEGRYLLKVEFEGRFSPDGHGLHKYQYQHRETGEMHSLMATRFEATFARRVFPCFDEPAMKSRFRLNIIHPSNYSAVSNMPEEDKIYMEDNLVRTAFSETPPMSTYLLFFLVSDFEYLEAHYKEKPVRAYAPPDRLHEAEHGLNLTIKLLDKFEQYFDVPYVLPKLDSIAIPNYTVPGMEHWGAISYDTGRFLVNETITEYNRIVKVDRVIAHEIVHQWFGNLVTMSWWSDLWLNEGMSTMIMYVPLKQYHPSIEEVDVRKMSRMMCADSSTDSHPIVRDADTPDEIAEAFDVISYEKGGAVMKMLQHILKDDFRLGLSNFLKKYAYKNAETKDLWDELSNATSMDLNISAMMDTWTRQMGFPFVQLKRDGATVVATQHWFTRDWNESGEVSRAFSPYGFIWKIPLVYKNLATGNEQTLWLNEKTATFQISALKDDAVKFNPGFVGFYIVKYDDADWARLGQRLVHNHESFAVTDRYNLLHDAFLLAETDRLPYDIALELTKYLGREKEALPWNLFRDHFLHFARRMDGEGEAMGLLKAYVRNLTADLYDEYVVSAHNNSMFRKRSNSAGRCSYTYIDLEFVPTIVDLACQSGNAKCVESAYEDLQLWRNHKNVSSDLHFVMEVAVGGKGDAQLWNLLSEELLEDTTEDRRRYMLAEGLVSFTDPELIVKTLQLMAFHPEVSPDLAKYMFQRLSKKPDAIPHLWKYTKEHWDIIMTKLDAKNNPSIGISIFCDKLKTHRYLGEFIQMMKSRPEISEFIVEGCIEEIQNSIEWVDKYQKMLTTWLKWNTPS